MTHHIHTKLMKIEEQMEPQTPSPASGSEIFLKEDKENSPDETSVVPFQSGDQLFPLPIPLPIIRKNTEMAKVETEKRMALIKAWEDNEKARAENRACKKINMVESWEERKKAILEFQLKKIEEKLEKAKANYREQQKNKVAELHKAAEEKKAEIEGQCGRNIVEIVGKADRYRATGRVPKKIIRCFSSISC